MIILGITGGSGCGKTSVSQILLQNGVEIIDGDIAARKIVEPNMPALSEIVNSFGHDYIFSDGTLNRKKLAQTVFSSPEKLELLNKITHKYISEYIDLYIEKSHAEIVGIDAAALLESNIWKKCDFIISVLAEKELRIKRIIKRDKIDRKTAENRINAQKNDNYYIEKSDYIVYNNGILDEIKEDILKILDDIRRKA